MGKTIGALARLIQREPVAFQGCVQATLAALVGFGLVHWTNEQVGLVLGVVAAVLAFLTRARVSPTATRRQPAAPRSPTGAGDRRGPSHDHRGMPRPSDTSAADSG